MHLLGRAYVHWTEGSKDNERTYTAEEIYINEEVYFIGSCECVLVH